MHSICQVAVRGANHQFCIPYTYIIPHHLAENAVIGAFCMVPFGRGDSPRAGVIIGFEERQSENIKSIVDIAPVQHALTAYEIKLCEYVKEQYFCGFFDAVKVVLPLSFIYKVENKDGKYLLKRHKKKPVTVVETEEPHLTQEIHLSCEQQKVYDAVSLLADIPDTKPALLYGVTASGKTLIFIKLIEQIIKADKSALVLLPEISLATQMAARLTELFGDSVTLVHSALSDTQRAVRHTGIKNGSYKIVVGTRTAVFAPMKNLGIIVVDEEQDSSYSSDQTPRFSAISVAMFRAKQEAALLLLSSATPSIATYYYAKKGYFHLFSLYTRYANVPLPKAELVDLKEQLKSGNTAGISDVLAIEIQKNLNDKKQTILLLNRRGYNTVAVCRECKTAKNCKNCSVPLVYHKKQNKLLCHYCAAFIPPEGAMCDECGGELIFSGMGTEHIETELSDRFKTARVLRMDTDSVSAKNSHAEILSAFSEKRADILVGTQMVAKGLDFEDVTLVGVLAIDALLFACSYKAFENVFALVTQVVGRGGRQNGDGKAIIETIDPQHTVLQLAAAQDYEAFYKTELEFRELGLYPPFCSLAVISFVSKDEQRATTAAKSFKQLIISHHKESCNNDIPLRVLGPAPYTIAVVGGKSRVKITVKCRNSKRFRDFLRDIFKKMTLQKSDSGVTVFIDFNSSQE